MMIKISTYLIIGLVLAACRAGLNTPQPTSQPTRQIIPTATSGLPAPTHTPMATSVATAPASVLQCADGFEKAKIQDPAKQKYGLEKGFTLSSDEFSRYLGVMGIESLCVPLELGAPYLNADWDSVNGLGVGRMLSIGFDNKLPGMGWGGLTLVYSTYDFKYGTEFDVYARTKDRDALRAGTMPGAFEINGVNGFKRLMSSQLCMGLCGVHMTYVFPFDSYYVTLVADIGAYDYDEDRDAAMKKFAAGEILAEYQPAARMAAGMVETIRFRPGVK